MTSADSIDVYRRYTGETCARCASTAAAAADGIGEAGRVDWRERTELWRFRR